MATSEPTRTKTNTPTPTETPEWANTDPNKPETWSTWAQVYFKDPEAVSKNKPELHQQFQIFLNESRKNFISGLSERDLRATLSRVVNPWMPTQYLNGLTPDMVASMTPEVMKQIAERMNPDELRWAMMGYNLNLAPEKRTRMVLSPQDMADILSDPKALVFTYARADDLTNFDPKIKKYPWMWGKDKDGNSQIQHLYGRWENSRNPLSWLVPFEQKFSQKVDVFGIPATFSGYPSDSFHGDLYGIFRIPGTQQMSVIGIRQIDDKGQQSLLLVGATTQPITEDHAQIVAAEDGKYFHFVPDAGKITINATKYLEVYQMPQSTSQTTKGSYQHVPYDESLMFSHMDGSLYAEMNALNNMPLKDNDGITKSMFTLGIYHHGVLVMTWIQV